MLVTGRMMVITAAGTPPPSISTLTATDERNISCLQSWRVTVGWTIVNADNGLYKLKLMLGETTLDGNLNNATGSYLYNTGQLGDGSLFDTELALSFTLQVLRRSDDLVLQTVNVGTNKFYGGCP